MLFINECFLDKFIAVFLSLCIMCIAVNVMPHNSFGVWVEMLSFDPYAIMPDGNVSMKVGVFIKIPFSGILPSCHSSTAFFMKWPKTAIFVTKRVGFYCSGVNRAAPITTKCSPSCYQFKCLKNTLKNMHLHHVWTNAKSHSAHLVVARTSPNKSYM